MPLNKQLFEGETIIEEGSNANGEWIKLGSGRMICYKVVNLVYAAATELSATWTYPQAFLAGTRPTITFSLSDTTVVASILGASYSKSPRDNVSTVLAQSNLNGGTSFVSGNAVNLDVIAIGRWK